MMQTSEPGCSLGMSKERQLPINIPLRYNHSETNTCEHHHEHKGEQEEQARKSSEDTHFTGYARFEKVWAR